MNKHHWAAALVSVALIAPGSGFAQSPGQVEFPEEYRSWARVKSEVILEGHEYFELFGGFHHVYANDLALEALKHGRAHPKGAILVFELFQAVTVNKIIGEGARLVVGVMEKDPDRFDGPGGWGFEDFKGSERERAVTDAQAQCLASCHETQKNTDYVYSRYRE